MPNSVCLRSHIGNIYLLLFFLTSFFGSVSSSSLPALRAQAAFPQITPAFPVFDGLHPRQDSSKCISTGNTLCPDGNGCCPSNAACTSTISGGSAYPLCAVACDGGPTCTTPITACCPRGLTCAPDGLCNTPTGTNTEVLVSITPPTAISFQPTTPTTAPANPTTAPRASISSVFGEASSSIEVSVSTEESSLGTSQTVSPTSHSAPSASILKGLSIGSSQTRSLNLGGGISTATGSGQASDPSLGDGSRSDVGRELAFFGSLLVSWLLIL
jgi:hypothetical protein